jgi:hypothetical protein
VVALHNPGRRVDDEPPDPPPSPKDRGSPPSDEERSDASMTRSDGESIINLEKSWRPRRFFAAAQERLYIPPPSSISAPGRKLNPELKSSGRHCRRQCGRPSPALPSSDPLSVSTDPRRGSLIVEPCGALQRRSGSRPPPVVLPRFVWPRRLPARTGRSGGRGDGTCATRLAPVHRRIVDRTVKTPCWLSRHVL